MAQVTSAVQPDMRIIVIMRNPVERLYSAYWYYGCMYGGKGAVLSAEGFHAAAQREVGLVSKCIAGGASMRQCARELFGVAQQLVKGMYAAFAPDWLAAYPGQIMWIRAEDYYADERKYLQVCFLHLRQALLCQVVQGGLSHDLVVHVRIIEYFSGSYLHRQRVHVPAGATLQCQSHGRSMPIRARLCMQGVVDWLDLPIPEEAIWTKVLDERANRGNPHHGRVQGCEGAHPDMLNETHELLSHFYAPWNAMLAAQLGPEFAWEPDAR